MKMREIKQELEITKDYLKQIIEDNTDSLDLLVSYFDYFEDNIIKYKFSDFFTEIRPDKSAYQVNYAIQPLLDSIDKEAKLPELSYDEIYNIKKEASLYVSLYNIIKELYIINRRYSAFKEGLIRLKILCMFCSLRRYAKNYNKKKFYLLFFGII